MRYYVLDANGNRYGPADVPTLNAWVQEGRVSSAMLLEEEGSGIKVQASSVPGLVFQAAPPFAPPGQPYAGYTRPGQVASGGSGDITAAYVLGIIGFCCGPLSAIGLFFANRARKNEVPGALAPYILCIVSFSLWILWIVLRAAFGLGRF
jgi:hypothetical protein